MSPGPDASVCSTDLNYIRVYHIDSNGIIGEWSNDNYGYPASWEYRSTRIAVKKNTTLTAVTGLSHAQVNIRIYYTAPDDTHYEAAWSGSSWNSQDIPWVAKNATLP